MAYLIYFTYFHNYHVKGLGKIYLEQNQIIWCSDIPVEDWNITLEIKNKIKTNSKFGIPLMITMKDKNGVTLMTRSSEWYKNLIDSWSDKTKNTVFT